MWKKTYHTNTSQGRAGVAIVTSDKIDFGVNNITRDKEDHFIMIKKLIQQINNTNIYTK